MPHRTVPIPETVEKVKGYGTLTIFQMEASPYWYARFFEDGKIRKKSTKKIHKVEAIAEAKKFFGELQGLKFGETPGSKKHTFAYVARSHFEETKARQQRGEISKSKLNFDEVRLEKDILPALGKMAVEEVDYMAISRYLNKLSAPPRNLSSASLKIHLSHIKTILKHAQQLRVIAHLPAFPKLSTVDSPRAWFTAHEYNVLHNTAKANIGRTFPQVATTGEQLRNITLTAELYDLIIFMVNTFIRPTDIRVLKHKDITIKKGDSPYLRLAHGKTKGHSDPMVSMPAAVKVYERLLARQKEEGYGRPDDYVFQPEFSEERQRSYALRSLHRQFDQLLILTKLKTNNQNKPRSLYSLRHTSIMLRLVNGDGIDSLVLARNARTSVEMIDRFYARPLTGEMKVDMLHSRKKKKKAVEEGYDDVG